MSLAIARRMGVPRQDVNAHLVVTVLVVVILCALVAYKMHLRQPAEVEYSLVASVISYWFGRANGGAKRDSAGGE